MSTELEISRATLVEEWERQPGEPAKGFKAFVLFRDDDDDRSVIKVRNVFGFAASQKQLLIWATTWRWVDRANAYDRYIDRRRVKAHLDEVEAMARRQVHIGQVLQQRGLEYVDENLATPEDRAKHLTANGALRFVTVGVDLEREGLGIDDDGDAGETNIQINVLDAGTQDTLFSDIREIASKMVRARGLSAAPLHLEPDPEDEDVVDAELVEAE